MMAQTKEEVLEVLLLDVQAQLEDLFQSGFDTVHDSTLEELRDMVGLTKQYGMTRLSYLLEQLTAGIEMRRHRATREADNLAGIYAQLEEYLYICKGKIAYDRGAGYYTAVREEEII